MLAFKIKKILVKKLPGFEKDLEIECNNLTSLIGPNGSGKTTTLLAVHSAFEFLNMCVFEKGGQTVDPWLNWEEVEIQFSADEPFKAPPSMPNLGDSFKEIRVNIRRYNGQLLIYGMHSEFGGYEIVDINNLYLRSSKMGPLEAEIANLKANKESFNTSLNNLRRNNSNHPSMAATQQQLDNTNNQIREKEEAIRHESVSLFNYSPEPVTRSALEDLVRKLELPNARLIRFGQTDFADIKSTIKRISDIRGGNFPDEKYREIKDQLKELLQQEPHFYNIRDKAQDFLELSGVDYQKASTGTKICLFYFSLVFESNKNDIILWDEPENGLHPTRRFKVVDLILKDSRQFLIATHSTEMAPLFKESCNVIRTQAEYRQTDNRNYITFQVAHDRRDAFELADKLGLNPARLLFTANVAIWVEGPSDMIFWRRMLELHPDGKNFVEGFDYTFVMYGGKSISHLTALEANQKLDILAISSHPILIVDSDIDEANKFSNIEANLKEVAKGLLEEFKSDNSEAGSNLFLYSLGREMENYFPSGAIKYAIKKVAPSLTENEIQRANFLDDDWPQHEKYHEMIHRKFSQAGIINGGGEEAGKPKGYTRWGEKNKTAMVKSALEWDELRLDLMKYNFGSQLAQIVEFIKRWQS